MLVARFIVDRYILLYFFFDKIIGNLQLIFPVLKVGDQF